MSSTSNQASSFRQGPVYISPRRYSDQHHLTSPRSTFGRIDFLSSNRDNNDDDDDDKKFMQSELLTGIDEDRATGKICFHETHYVPRKNREGLVIMDRLATEIHTRHGSLLKNLPIEVSCSLPLIEERVQRSDGLRIQVQLIERFIRADDKKVKSFYDIQKELEKVESLYRYVFCRISMEKTRRLSAKVYNLLMNTVCYILGGYSLALWPVGALICSPGKWKTLAWEKKMAKVMLHLAMEYRRLIMTNDHAFSDLDLPMFIEFTEELVRNFENSFSSM